MLNEQREEEITRLSKSKGIKGLNFWRDIAEQFLNKYEDLESMDMLILDRVKNAELLYGSSIFGLTEGEDSEEKNKIQQP